MAFNWLKPEREPEEKRAARWDSMSESFDGFERQSAENNPLLALLEKKGIVRPDMRVLDIGCAAGKYSLYFAEKCREAVGTDISPEMLRRARLNAESAGLKNLRFIKSDWDTLDIEAIGGRGSFDFIFANMTPAISSKADLDKLLEAAGGWCYFGGAASIKRKFADKIYDLLGMKKELRGNQQSVPLVFSQLWDSGYRPELYYVPSGHKKNMSTEEAKEHYIKTAGSAYEQQKGNPLDEEQIKALCELIEKEAVNGRIYEEFSTQTAVLLWNVNDK